MLSSSNTLGTLPKVSRAGSHTLAKWLLLLAGIAAALAILVGLALQPRAPAAPVEVDRSLLVLRNGCLFLTGKTEPFTGLMLEHYEGHSLRSRSMIVDGRLQGLSEGWYTNGQKQVEESFVAGISHGKRIKWHPNGQKLSETAVVHGKLEGTFRSWHENGEPANIVEFKDGQPDGLCRAYFPSGFLKAEATLRNGELVKQKFWKDGESKEPEAPNLVSVD